MPAFIAVARLHLRQPAWASVFALSGFLAAACSSGTTEPNHYAGGAGAAGSAGASSPGAGAAGTVGAGLGGATSASGASQGGAAAGGSGAGIGGGAASVAGAGGSVAGVAGAGGSLAGAGGGVAGAGGTGGGPSGSFALLSSAFGEGEEIPLKYKCANVNPKGQNISPPLSWGPGPAGTKSYAIVLMHVPSPEHWVLWDIPANVTSLPENIEHVAQPSAPVGSKQSLANLDGFSGSGYLGPCPQAPNSRQSYQFTVYALDVDQLPGLSATSTPTAAATAVKAHLVGGSQGASLTGTQIQTP